MKITKESITRTYDTITKIIATTVLYVTLIGMCMEALDYNYTGFFHEHFYSLFIASLVIYAIPYIYYFIMAIILTIKEDVLNGRRKIDTRRNSKKSKTSKIKSYGKCNKKH